MTDIKQAIQELREAVKRGDGWRNVSQLYSNLRSVITKRDQVEIAYRELCRVLPANRLDLGFNVEATLAAITALESAVEGGTVDYGTPCLPPQSQAEREAHILLNIIVNRLEEPSNLRCYISRNMAWGLISFDALTLMAEALGRWENDGPDNPDGGWILPESACKPSPTPDLTVRIQAAAEEIADSQVYSGWTDGKAVADIAAIIRRNLEVKR